MPLVFVVFAIGHTVVFLLWCTLLLNCRAREPQTRLLGGPNSLKACGSENEAFLEATLLGSLLLGTGWTPLLYQDMIPILHIFITRRITVAITMTVTITASIAGYSYSKKYNHLY